MPICEPANAAPGPLAHASPRARGGSPAFRAVGQAIAEETVRSTQPLVAFYVGDWDPSGLHMSGQDLPGRLAHYRAIVGEDDRAEGTPLIERVALTAADVADPDLPSFSADTRQGDPRWRWFVTRYGRTCWELDALSPEVLRERLEVAIEDRLDRASWNRYLLAERVEREAIIEPLRVWGELAGAPA